MTPLHYYIERDPLHLASGSQRKEPAGLVEVEWHIKDLKLHKVPIYLRESPVNHEAKIQKEKRKLKVVVI